MPKNQGAMPDYQALFAQIQQGLQRQAAAHPVQHNAPVTRDQTIANMQAKWGGGGQYNPMMMQQNVINRIGAKYGQAPVDLAAQQAQLQAQAQMKADALRQQAAQQQALQDPNNPQNPNAIFAGAAGGSTPKNQPPPDQYGGLTGGGN